MTQQEFEQRIGRKVSIEEYAKADAVYMASSLEKDEFCRDYKDHDCKLIQDLAHRSNGFEAAMKATSTQLLELGRRLAQLANEKNDEELRYESRNILGMSGYIKHCIEKKYILTDDDLRFVHDCLIK